VKISNRDFEDGAEAMIMDENNLHGGKNRRD